MLGNKIALALLLVTTLAASGCADSSSSADSSSADVDAGGAGDGSGERADGARDTRPDTPALDTSRDALPAFDAPREAAADAAADAAPLPDRGADLRLDRGADHHTTDASNACEAVGGICIGSAADCTGNVGRRRPAGDPGCIFALGPGACCALRPLA